MSLYIQRDHEGEGKGEREKEGLKTGKDATWEKKIPLLIFIFSVELNLMYC